MKRIGSRNGERVWYELEEIEKIAAEALRSAGLQPTPSALAVDVETLVEIHLGAIVDYAGELPDAVLGYTILNVPPRVVVNRRLTDLANAPQAALGIRGRWRATIAHEAAHILLHAPLARISSTTPKLTDESISNAVADPSNWREVQANMGMAALLMPRAVFCAEARRLLERDPAFPPLDHESLAAMRLVDVLAHEFETSMEATRLRLVTFGWISRPTIDAQGRAQYTGSR